jgi:hypothetical protein
MIKTSKTVSLYEATKTLDREFNSDIDALEEFLMEPFKMPHVVFTQVTVPTNIKFQFLAFHVIKSLYCMVQDEMMTQETAEAFKTAIEESGAYEIEINYTYEFKTRVKGCNFD